MIASSNSPIRLMRFERAVRHDPSVDRWFEEQPKALDRIARPWFEFMRNLGDDVRELLHDGHPTACVGTAAFAYVNAFTAHINVGFFLGAWLDDPASLLEGTGKRMRHVKLGPEAESDPAALEALVRAAYNDMRGRLRVDGW